jgi:glycine cleavage system H protein
MSQVPEKLRYAKTHEWVSIEDDGTVIVGISDHAQGLLGDIVFVELPELNAVEAGAECAVVESVKAASDIYSPLNGTVVAVNEALSEQPELINTEAYGAGWLFKLKVDHPDAINALMNAESYAQHLEAED